MKFIRWFNRNNFIFQATDWYFGDLLGVWKLATNKKIMPARQKKNTGTWDVDTNIVINIYIFEY